MMASELILELQSRLEEFGDKEIAIVHNDNNDQDTLLIFVSGSAEDDRIKLVYVDFLPGNGYYPQNENISIT